MFGINFLNSTFFILFCFLNFSQIFYGINLNGFLKPFYRLNDQKIHWALFLENTFDFYLYEEGFISTKVILLHTHLDLSSFQSQWVNVDVDFIEIADPKFLKIPNYLLNKILPDKVLRKHFDEETDSLSDNAYFKIINSQITLDRFVSLSSGVSLLQSENGFLVELQPDGEKVLKKRLQN
jgi:hypothetical protein